MGLAERRAAKEFEDTQFATLKDEIMKLAGTPIALEINWNQLAAEGYAHLYKESWPEIYFKPVIDGLRQIGRDAMGRDALKAALKKIEFRNSTGSSSPHSAITFQDGALVIDHEPCTNVGDTKDRTKYLVELVEKAL